MRLLYCDPNGNYSLKNTTPSDVPPYAILSHTWGADEVIFSDLTKIPSEWQRKAGFEKIDFCAKQARRDGLQYFWVDTCCIDKSDSQELQTAINSMFRWYRDAERCYVFLSDISGLAPPDNSFRQSRWFTRGWTLQELIAPKVVDFYSKDRALIGNKQSLESIIRDITGIPSTALRGAPLSNFPISEREAWICGRQTKYEEDMVYSLLGICDVHMPLIYGEGQGKAHRRLREEVQKTIKGTMAHDFSIPFSLSEAPEINYFVARENEIIEMRRILSSDGSRRVVVLHGLGGIGKTQLAVSYMKRYRDEYSAIFWFNIKDKVSIEQSFVGAARQILQYHPNASRLGTIDLQGDQDEVISAVKVWLSLPGNTRWLIIYDNYDSPQLPNQRNEKAIDITHFLPTSWQGSIIVTTRQSQVDLGHCISIKKLECIHDSLEILSSTSGRGGLGDDPHAKTLVERLDGLPLALAMAGTYLRRVPLASFADYRRLYETSWARLHAGMRSLGSYKDRTLCSTWQVSLEQVQAQNPLAASLLHWWAYFDNQDIWFELFQSHSEDFPTWVNELADELNFNNAMGTLHDYGFVELQTLSDNIVESRGYSIHSCLHSWTINILSDKSDRTLQKAAFRCIASRVPSQDQSQYWLLQRRLLPHAVACSGISIEENSDLNQAFHSMGLLFTDQSRLKEAEEMFMRAVAGYEKALGPNHTSTLDTFNNLGNVYAHQGKHKKAEEIYVRALTGYEKASGPGHMSTLDTVNNLGNIYMQQGRYKEAEAMYMHAIAGKEKAFGPDHILTLDTINNLGNIYTEQGKYKDAGEIYMRALIGYEKTLGPDHITTLDIVNNLGNMYIDQGKYKEAEKMYMRALIGKEQALGPDHISTLIAVNNLGNLYIEQGKYKEAEEMYIRAVEGNKKALGPDHISTLGTFNNLALLYIDQGKHKEAEEIYIAEVD